ncbi:hypothetical protein ACFWIB_39890 [Streptomyces sp. NPDC127051]|uniref:hypothetical protein n=1 Tax=Streptomyces sp. NPDC127051 TaxID=3347119 RepID=UPI003646356C
MAEETDALVAMTRILSPHCHVTGMSSGALIADCRRRTPFLGMTTTHVQKFVVGSAEERAEFVTDLIRAGCATDH